MSSVVFYSGGICSHLAAKRWVQAGNSPTLLFSDTGVEDDDLYRFVSDGAQWLGCELVIVKAEFSFEEMCIKQNALPNDRMPFCSRELKVEPAKKWLSDHANIQTIVVGLDWTETHRLPKVAARWGGYSVVAPMMDPPYKMKAQMIDEVESDGLPIPRLYTLGFPHNNCGGGCVRNGHKSWKMLHETLPERFGEWVKREQLLGGVHTFSRSRKGGTSRPIALEEIVRGEVDEHDFGGCGCFVE